MFSLNTVNKLLLLVIVMNLKIFSINGIICWQCSASSEKECKETGYFELCYAPHSKFICHTKWTRSRGHFQIVKGCKQATACIDERKQNWGRLGQCKKGLQSTCRCCCYKDFCNDGSCLREKKKSCPALPPLLNNGSVLCSDGNNVGSTCKFRCPRRNDGKDITMTPDYGNMITCLPNGKWSSPIPNCREPCYPNVRIDFIVISHRPTEAEAIEVVRRASAPFINSVKLGPENLHLARMHYRTHVHQPHLQLFDADIKNSSEIIEFLENPPFEPDDTGPVNTGAVLWYVYNNIINKRGDRPNVPNILLIDTVATADDDVITPARALRKAGVVIQPRFDPGPNTNYQKAKEEMDAIAGYRSNWFVNKFGLIWNLGRENAECHVSFPIVV